MTSSSKIPILKEVLDNGLVLLISPNSKLPLLSFNAFVLAGSDQNPMQSPGLASLTSRLLDEGTHRYSSQQIAELVEGIGGHLSIYAQRELTALSVQVRSDYVDRGLELTAEMLRFPTFPADRLELERRTVLNHLQALADDPQTVASQLLSREIYRGTPLQFPSLGTSESIESLTSEQLREFHKSRYGPQATLLVAVGDCDPEGLRQAVVRELADWENEDFEHAEISGFERIPELSLVEHAMEKEQLNIYLGHLGITRRNPDYYPLQVMDVILGGGPGFTSRIPRVLRDEQGLAYSTYSDISGSSGIYPGRFVAYISTSPENRRRALEGLRNEIESMVESGISDEELHIAQEYLTGSFVFDFQSSSAVARFLVVSEIFQLGDDYPQRYPEIVRSVSKQDVLRVAQKYLDAVNLVTVIVGPINDTRENS